MATIMPEVAEDLGRGGYGAAFSAFFLGSVVGVLFGGPLADRFGAARPFAAAAVCVRRRPRGQRHRPDDGRAGGRPDCCRASAPGPPRPIVYTVIGRAYPEAARLRMFAVISTAWVLPGVLGPGLAGLVAEHAGWRWVFLGLLPLVAVAVGATLPPLRRVPPSPGAASHPAVAPRRGPPGRPRPPGSGAGIPTAVLHPGPADLRLRRQSTCSCPLAITSLRGRSVRVRLAGGQPDHAGVDGRRLAGRPLGRPHRRGAPGPRRAVSSWLRDRRSSCSPSPCRRPARRRRWRAPPWPASASASPSRRSPHLVLARVDDGQEGTASSALSLFENLGFAAGPGVTGLPWWRWPTPGAGPTPPRSWWPGPRRACWRWAARRSTRPARHRGGAARRERPQPSRRRAAARPHPEGSAKFPSIGAVSFARVIAVAPARPRPGPGCRSATRSWRSPASRCAT